MNRLLRTVLLFVLTLLLGGCGLHLRGQAQMPFDSLYLQAPNLYAPLVVELRRALTTNNVKIAAQQNEATLTLQIVSEIADQQILSLSRAGRVSEYRLRYRVSLRAYDAQQQEWMPAQEIQLQRDLTYSDTQILAKQEESAMLYKDMRSDAVQQILRRLSRAKPHPTE
jgi:LPS-assembly lipoprotein